MNQYYFNPENYIYFYYIFIFLISSLYIFFLINSNWNKIERENLSNLIGYPFLFFITFIYSFKPIYYNTGDLQAYLSYYYKYREQVFFDWNTKESLFFGLTWILSKIMIPEFYFAILGSIYVLSIYSACKNWFKKEWFILFIFIVTSFQFLNYGLNGVRQGLATSLFILAISRKNLFLQFILFYIALGMHKTIILPIFAYLLSYILNNPKYYIFLWLLCIPLSITNGSFFEGLLETYYEEGSEYFTDYYDDEFSATGFRIDFILYSSLPILTGIYYIYYKKIKDLIFQRMYSTYLFCNSFWILVIGISYSNRMAYLSWFMMGLVLIYPIYKIESDKLEKNIYITLFAFYISITIFLNRMFIFN